MIPGGDIRQVMLRDDCRKSLMLQGFFRVVCVYQPLVEGGFRGGLTERIYARLAAETMTPGSREEARRVGVHFSISRRR